MLFQCLRSTVRNYLKVFFGCLLAGFMTLSQMQTVSVKVNPFHGKASQRALWLLENLEPQHKKRYKCFGGGEVISH